MRGATPGQWLEWLCRRISIHAPHAGSDYGNMRQMETRSYFNPRSPCGERPVRFLPSSRIFEFQSTLPMRGATFARLFFTPKQTISIHAPHAGSDLKSVFSAPKFTNFNPRSPCGERRLLFLALASMTIFQSTLPMRGATASKPKRVL